MKRDDIVFAGMTGIFGGATGLALAYLLRSGFKEETVFALIGAIIGAFATVGGAVYAEHWKRTKESNAEVSGDVFAIAGEALQHGKSLAFVHHFALKRVQQVIHEYLDFWQALDETLAWDDDRNYPDLTAEMIREY